MKNFNKKKEKKWTKEVATPVVSASKAELEEIKILERRISQEAPASGSQSKTYVYFLLYFLWFFLFFSFLFLTFFYF